MFPAIHPRAWAPQLKFNIDDEVLRRVQAPDGSVDDSVIYYVNNQNCDQCWLLLCWKPSTVETNDKLSVLKSSCAGFFYLNPCKESDRLLNLCNSIRVDDGRRCRNSNLPQSAAKPFRRSHTVDHLNCRASHKYSRANEILPCHWLVLERVASIKVLQPNCISVVIDINRRSCNNCHKLTNTVADRPTSCYVLD